jgi:hypothetical protein
MEKPREFLASKFVDIMKKNNWTAKLYAPRDIDEYIDLILSEYGDTVDTSKPEYIKWQYHDNPAGEACMYLSIADNKIVGAYSILPIGLIIDGEETLGSVSVNTLTHKDYRGVNKRIFTTLAEITYNYAFKDRGIKNVYGVPNQNSYLGFTKILGFKDIGYMDLLIKINNLGNILRLKNRFVPVRLFNLVSKIFRANIKLNKTRDDNLHIKTIDRFDDRFDEFWNENKGLFSNFVARTKEYLNWRYVDNHVRRYEIFSANDNTGKIRGYIVCRQTEIKGIKTGLIGDLLVAQNDVDVTDLLIKQAQDYFYQEDVDMFGVLMFNHIPYYKVFLKNGFLKCPKMFEPQPFPMIVRSLDEKDKRIYDKENWYLTMGDYDVF